MKYKIMLPLLLIIGLSVSLSAGLTKYIEQSGYFDFAAGFYEGISVDDTGRITLAPDYISILDMNEMFVWDMVEDSKGTLYCSTGSGGLIYRITRGADPSVHFMLEGAEITALAIDKNDNLYAAVSTRGIIYKIDSQGQAEVFQVLEPTYIWNMLTDKEGSLLVATGNDAFLYRISPSKKLEVLFEAAESHFTALTTDPQGRIYLGGAEEGLVYRIDPNGETEVLFDADGLEIGALAIGPGGDLYVGTSAQREKALPFPLLNGSDENHQRKSPAQVVNYVYRVNSRGDPLAVIEINDLYFLSMTSDREGRIYVGSGGYGEIFRIDENNTVTRLFSLPASQILSLLKSKNGQIYAGTGDLGNVYKLEPHFTAKGTFISEVFDTKFHAQFGRLETESSAPEGTKMEIYTRSGNSAIPGAYWNPWKGPINPENPVLSSPARFIQYKIHMQSDPDKTSTPVLARIRLAYRQNNQPPFISSIKIEQPDPELQPSNFSASKLRVRIPQIWERNVTWESEDPNEDNLEFTLSLKNSDDPKAPWLLIQEHIEENSLVFDSRKIPDGRYLFRITASDIPSNPPAEALRAEKITKSVLIDNTAPLLKDLLVKQNQNGTWTCSARISDALSPIRSIEYSSDLRDWLPLLPADRICDGLSETIRLDLPADTETLMLRFRDTSENQRTQSIYP